METFWFQTIYVLFFIELGSRQARQLVWELSDREKPLRFLIHDNDRKFSKAFDAVFESEGFHVIHTPFQAPNANAFAETLGSNYQGRMH